jgi:hypothetical protein
MNIFTQEQLSELLQSGECIIEFTKVNGEIRSMPCTLNESMIPPSPVHITNTDNPIDFPIPRREKKTNPDVMNVWCIDKKEWRSFRIANVISAKAKE